MIYKEGPGNYGQCWSEGDGVTFWVYVMDGQLFVVLKYVVNRRRTNE